MNNTACSDTVAAAQGKLSPEIPAMRFLDDGFRKELLAADAEEGCPLAARLLSGLTGVKDIRIRHFFHPHVFITDGGFVHTMHAHYVDTKNRHYLIEAAHGTDRNAICNRTRVDCAALDIDVDFDREDPKLPEVHLIYLLEHDVFEDNRPFYTVVTRTFDTEGHIIGELHDGRHLVFFNAAYAGDDNRLRLLRELNDDTLKAIG